MEVLSFYFSHGFSVCDFIFCIKMFGEYLSYFPFRVFHFLHFSPASRSVEFQVEMEFWAELLRVNALIVEIQNTSIFSRFSFLCTKTEFLEFLNKDYNCTALPNQM